MRKFFYIFCFILGWCLMSWFLSCQKERIQISEVTRLEQIRTNIPQISESNIMQTPASRPAENLQENTTIPAEVFVSVTPNFPLGTNQIDDSDSNVQTDEAEDEQDWFRPEVEDEMKE